MADLPNIEKNRVVIEGPSGTDLAITSAGNAPADLLKVGGTDITLGQKAMSASVPVVIPSDQSAVPVYPTIQPTGKVYSATYSKTAIGTTELNHLFLKNPSGSGKTLHIRKIIIEQSHTVAGSWVRARLYANPTTSANGTAVTAVPAAIGSGNTASATPFQTPTSSANGSQIADYNCLSGGTVIDKFEVGEFTIAANNTLLVTVVADGTSRVCGITIFWCEV